MRYYLHACKDNGTPWFQLRMILYTCLPHSLIQPEARGDFSTVWRWMHTNFNHKRLLMTHYTETEVLRISTEIGKWLLVM